MPEWGPLGSVRGALSNECPYRDPDSKGEGARRLVAPYYRVLVDVADKRLHALPETFQMIPGMTVTAEMKVGHRSVISYFLYPLLRGLDESIREP